jgi:NAD(P)-dependent dehydrogenase (short-subunit alcohol dehydrogenase family)
MPDTQFGPQGWTPERLGSLAGKTYLITGTTSGTGLEATRILLARGAHVVMLNRNVEKSSVVTASLRQEFGKNAQISFIQLDLSSLASVRDAAEKVLGSVPRIDALICNAAIAQVPKRILTADGFESQLGTNHYGHFLLSGMLFDRIDECGGRIVVVASLGYKLGLRTIRFDDMNWDNNYRANPAYSQSKLAQMMFAYELQDRIRDAGRRAEILVCHPGASSTSLIDTSGGIVTRLVWSLISKSPWVQSAERGAFPQVMCATEPGLVQRAFYGPTGSMEATGPVGAGTLETYAYDKTVMARLWDISEQETGFEWSV